MCLVLMRGSEFDLQVSTPTRKAATLCAPLFDIECKWQSKNKCSYVQQCKSSHNLLDVIKIMDLMCQTFVLLL
jgi:hypothetical protein